MSDTLQHNQILTERNKILSHNLDKAVSLHKLYQTTECRQVLIPALQQASQIQWLNPQDYPSKEAFQQAYDIAYAKAQANLEIINLLEGAEKAVNRLQLELARPQTGYSLADNEERSK